ncbi:hypothetical protein ACFRMQ_00335 [Kitasatospora sp. NPDC056783]|uniref:hypothetical protein n=1 Tax=Kitasatospora sp. NPDC056783 TaxID=3345943 RepID=UPI0036A1A5E6
MTSPSTTNGVPAFGDRTRIPAERVRTGPGELSAAAARAGVPAALLVSSTVPRTGVRATRNSGRPAVTCSYLDGSFTRAERAMPLRERGPQMLLETVLPGVTSGEAKVFIESTLQPALVAVAGRWRAYTLQAHGLLLLAVVPDRPGASSAPHLHLVGPTITRVPEVRGAA